MSDTVFFSTSDGVELCGVFSKPKNETKSCIVMCHGISVDKDEDGLFVDLESNLNNTGFATFRFDFRGHGKSEGNSVDMTVAGEVKDLTAAVDYVKQKGFENIGLVGASFGAGASAIYVGRDSGVVDALVLWYPLIDYHSLKLPVNQWTRKFWGKSAFEAGERNGFIWINEKTRFKVGQKLLKEIQTIHPWKFLKKYSQPILIVHGNKDTYVPYEDSVQIAKQFPNCKLATINGAGHGFDNHPRYIKMAIAETVAFFTKNRVTF